MSEQTEKEKPIRIQRKRIKGWRMPKNTVYVGRPSKWGNPFNGPDALKLYREMAETLLKPGSVWFNSNRKIMYLYHKDLLELRGKNLACWCPLDKPCHADILLELAND